MRNKDTLVVVVEKEEDVVVAEDEAAAEVEVDDVDVVQEAEVHFRMHHGNRLKTAP